MGKVVMYSSVSVDGFIADENDQPGPLFDWLLSGDVPLDESGVLKVSQTSYDYVRPENRPFVALDREKIRQMNRADVEAKVTSGELAFGSAREVTERLIETAEHVGANVLLLNLNLGAVPHDLHLEQVRRFGREVLPKLQAHRVARVPAAEALV